MLIRLLKGASLLSWQQKKNEKSKISSPYVKINLDFLLGAGGVILYIYSILLYLEVFYQFLLLSVLMLHLTEIKRYLKINKRVRQVRKTLMSNETTSSSLISEDLK